jgi:cytochrome c553
VNRILIITLVIGMLTLIPARDIASAEPEMTGAWLENTAAIFEDRCSICHEEDGNSDVEKLNLVDRIWQHGGTIEQIEVTIRDGIPETKMKPQAGKLTDEEISDLARYVKYLEKMHHGETGMTGSSSGEPSTASGPDSSQPTVPDLSKLPELRSLRILPENPVMHGSESRQLFIVSGRFADGIERELTAISQFSVPDTSPVKLTGPNRVQAINDGETIIRAVAGSLEIETGITVKDTGTPRPFSFDRHIGGILTRNGCNASDCHGGVKGRGGFKLSFNVLNPAGDYDWIIHGGGYKVLTTEIEGERIPRINIEEPEKSLLLLKPTFSIDHEGGKRFDIDSNDYRMLVEWIRSGAPYNAENADTLKIRRLKVEPSDAVLLPGQAQQLIVTAELENGYVEDVTDQVSFRGNNSDVLKLTGQGLVVGVDSGEADVIVRAVGQSISVRVGVIRNPVTDYPEVSTRNFIDEHVFSKLRKLHVIPSGTSSDEEFIRRICLDLTGKLPPPRRVKQFLDDTDPDKRDKLIEILLDTPEYVDHWTRRFEYLIPDVRRGIALDIPYDQIVRERISAQGYSKNSKAYLKTYKAVLMNDASTYDLRHFMGRRFDCAECHDHPFDAWSQNQYWGMTAFYARLTSTELREDRILIEDMDGEEIDYGKTPDNELMFHRAENPRTKVELVPTYLDGSVLPEKDRNDPRLHLANWMVTHPYFAETAVNLIWSYFFGRGIVDPVDNFGSFNPPTHPDLLQALAEDFRDHGHDLKHLMRRITRSRTYQLSSLPNPTNTHDTINYSHAQARPMEPEVLFAAIESVTGRPVESKERFLDIFNDPEKPNLLQALHLLVGSTFTDELSREGGLIDGLASRGSSLRDSIEELYMTSLSRFPDQQETDDLEKLLVERSSLVANPFFNENRARHEVIEDLIWALISSREFMYNH